MRKHVDNDHRKKYPEFRIKERIKENENKKQTDNNEKKEKIKWKPRERKKKGRVTCSKNREIPRGHLTVTWLAKETY